MAVLRAVIRGCGDVPGYGPHPGAPVLLMLVIMGFVAGLARGFLGALIGAAVMAVLFGVPFLFGAYDRGRIR
jgi:hypothetical protein